MSDEYWVSAATSADDVREDCFVVRVLVGHAAMWTPSVLISRNP